MLLCVFRIVKQGEELLLIGEEKENGVITFRTELSFSLFQKHTVESFAASLADSRTFPRMMIELAEEYFSSACFD